MTFPGRKLHIEDAPQEMRSSVSKYQSRFNIEFETLTYFSQQALAELHEAGRSATTPPTTATIASFTDPSILEQVSVLTRVANSAAPTSAQRKVYLSALQKIYKMLPVQPRSITAGSGPTLCVAPEREGRILAEGMGWCKGTENVFPQAKRILFDGGIVVGLSGMPKSGSWLECVIIDGAIASGSTIMAIMGELRETTSCFHIFSVHSTYGGLWALHQCAESLQVELRVIVGHSTLGMNSKFYALDPSDKSRLAVGDLGDMISELDSRTTER